MRHRARPTRAPPARIIRECPTREPTMTLPRAPRALSVLALVLLVCRLSQPPTPYNMSPYQPESGGRRFRYVCPQCGSYRRLPKKVLTPPRCSKDGYRMEYMPRRKKG